MDDPEPLMKEGQPLPAVVHPILLDALEAVPKAEAAALGTSSPSCSFRLADRVAERVDPDNGLVRRRLADPRARTLLRHCLVVNAIRSRSDVVVLGKYARPRDVKARSYLVHEGHSLSLKVWRTAAGEDPLGRHEREVRGKVARIPDYRAPEVVTSGSAGDVDYLLEVTVYGRTPTTPTERLAAGYDLVPALLGAYQQSGLHRRRLRRVTHPRFIARLASALEDPTLMWDYNRWGSRPEFIALVQRLVLRNKRVICALGHGDIVSSNIIRRAGAYHVLADWERARDMPIAFDLGKLAFSTNSLGFLLDYTLPLLQTSQPLRRGEYPWHEQSRSGSVKCCRGVHIDASVRRRSGAVRSLRWDNPTVSLGLPSCCRTTRRCRATTVLDLAGQHEDR